MNNTTMLSFPFRANGRYRGKVQARNTTGWFNVEFTIRNIRYCTFELTNQNTGYKRGECTNRHRAHKSSEFLNRHRSYNELITNRYYSSNKEQNEKKRKLELKEKKEILPKYDEIFCEECCDFHIGRTDVQEPCLLYIAEEPKYDLIICDECHDYYYGRTDVKKQCFRCRSGGKPFPEMSEEDAQLLVNTVLSILDRLPDKEDK